MCGAIAPVCKVEETNQLQDIIQALTKIAEQSAERLQDYYSKLQVLNTASSENKGCLNTCPCYDKAKKQGVESVDAPEAAIAL
ncbi:hypothetical protein HC256_008847 [Beauveria bassiana]|nr:hypothetical protein HC256_008847 [Beauveria bassiana]